MVRYYFSIQGAKVQHFFELSKFFGKKKYFLFKVLHI